MSDYSTNASVTLIVNGKEAEETLTKLKQRASDYRDAIAKAAKEGNKAELTKLRKELRSTEHEIRTMQSSIASVDAVMRRLNKATPKELRSTLSHLNRELNKLERGSDAWNAHVEKIRQVKAELDAVNKSLSLTQTKGEKFWGWINKWQTPFTFVSEKLIEVIPDAVSGATQAYADMDTAMANTQKFTGMTREEVELLNEEFKKMDTRTSREGLNELAQAAGRLGKNSVEDVMGFVRAGDIIGVAMDELGADAPQIISQLARIFNLESEMGTEQAMLSVGSAINSLSQNCAASAPGLVDFAGRLGAIASSTHMSMDEMLAFGALLEDQKVSIEKSSTAIQGVITKMYANPAGFAQKAGIDVAAFTEALKRSSTEGVMMFVETLSQMDQMQQSATLTELKIAGAGVVQTFQTLAEKVDLLKTQMHTSKTAFDEATSATEEYNVQNNTVQANLDKARKKLKEVTIALGENLMPVVRGVIGGASQLAKILITVINILFEYKGVLITLTATIAAYNIAANIAIIKTKALAIAQGIARAAVAAWTVATQAATVAMALFSGNLHRLKQEWMLFSALLKASPIGLLVAGVTALCTGLLLLSKRTDAAAESQKTLNKIRDDAQQKIVDEKNKIDLLVAAAKNEKLSLDDRRDAINNLNEIIPDYNAHLDETTGKYTENKRALDDYLTSLAKSYELEGAKQQLGALGAEEAKIKIKQKEVQQTLDQFGKVDAKRAGRFQTTGGNAPAANFNEGVNRAYYQEELEDLQEQLELIEAKRSSIYSVYGIELQKKAIDESIDPDEGKCPKCHQKPCVCPETDPDKANKERFEAEKAWKEREEALNKLAWRRGERDYEEYITNMDQLAVEYYDKVLARTDLSEQERLEAEAGYYEAREKLAKTVTLQSEDWINNHYAMQLAEAKQFYIDGIYSAETYEQESVRIELERLRALVSITAEGSEERAAAEKKYQDAVFADAKRKRDKQVSDEKKHQEEIKKLREKYFGLTPLEQKKLTNSALAALDEAYAEELRLVGDNEEEKTRITKQYQKAREDILAQTTDPGFLDRVKGRTGSSPFDNLIEMFLPEDMNDDMQTTILNFASSIYSAYSSVTEMMQAETEIQIAAIEKRYEKEISLAEGNAYKVTQLEKKKEEEIAKAKDKASKRSYAMQVLQAVAQTAQNAIAAYGSAAAIPVTGFILAPIAASMAVAAGLLQIAAIKKQQEAAAAQGYASGGFTPKGGKYEPAGIVHKGEWVASQELLASPVARPMIDALEYAQRTNTIGSLRPEAVSYMRMASVYATPSNDNGAIAQTLATQTAAIAGYAEIIQKLNDRLNEPFVTVNTVTGDAGIKKAQDEYEKLIRNKRPKYRK